MSGAFSLVDAAIRMHVEGLGDDTMLAVLDKVVALRTEELRSGIQESVDVTPKEESGGLVGSRCARGESVEKVDSSLSETASEAVFRVEEAADRSGFCYLRLMKEEKRKFAAEQLGPNPVLAELLMLDPSWFLPVVELARYPIVLGDHFCHVLPMQDSKLKHSVFLSLLRSLKDGELLRFPYWDNVVKDMSKCAIPNVSCDTYRIGHVGHGEETREVGVHVQDYFGTKNYRGVRDWCHESCIQLSGSGVIRVKPGRSIKYLAFVGQGFLRVPSGVKLTLGGLCLDYGHDKVIFVSGLTVCEFEARVAGNVEYVSTALRSWDKMCRDKGLPGLRDVRNRFAGWLGAEAAISVDVGCVFVRRRGRLDRESGLAESVECKEYRVASPSVVKPCRVIKVETGALELLGTSCILQSGSVVHLSMKEKDVERPCVFASNVGSEVAVFREYKLIDREYLDYDDSDLSDSVGFCGA